MTVDEAIAVFASYSAEEKAEFLASLMHELTIIAHDSFMVGPEGVTHPQRARHINDVQHCLSAYLLALLRRDAPPFLDDVLVRIVMENPYNSDLERQLRATFERLTAAAARHTHVKQS